MSHGSRRNYTEATEITASNVEEEVNAAYLGHSTNRITFENVDFITCLCYKTKKQCRGR